MASDLLDFDRKPFRQGYYTGGHMNQDGAFFEHISLAPDGQYHVRSINLVNHCKTQSYKTSQMDISALRQVSEEHIHKKMSSQLTQSVLVLS